MRMRGIMIAGLAVVLLIVGILVIKNMGAGDSNGAADMRTEKVIERAEDAAEKATEKIKNLSGQVSESEAK